MSVSNMHGGGLTLQRVLGDELYSIREFFHVSDFGNAYPPAPIFLDRSTALPEFFSSALIKKLVGCTVASKLSRTGSMQRLHTRTCCKRILQSVAPNEIPRALVCPQGAQSLRVTEQLQQRIEMEYVTWVMDDHLIRWNGVNWYYPKTMESLFGKHLSNAKRVFVISPTMQAFYKARFGVDSDVLFGSADCNDDDQLPQLPHGTQLRLAYFGAIAAWQIDALAMLAKQLVALDATLDIYSGIQELPPTLVKPGVSLKGRIDAQHVASTMQAYHAVVLPISFRDELRHMSEFNIATKMSECLASNTATFVIGPNYAAMVRYLLPKNAALLATEPNGQDIGDCLSLLRDTAFRHSLIAQAHRLVRTELTTAVMRRIWRHGVETAFSN